MNRTDLDPTLAITGVGCVLPGCSTPERFWNRLLNVETAISGFGGGIIASKLVSHFAGISEETTELLSRNLPGRLRRFASPCSVWGVQAAADALKQAQIDPKRIPEDRCGLFTAQGDYLFPSLPSFSRGVSKIMENQRIDLPALTNEFINHQGMDPFVVIKSLANNLLAIASLTFGIRGDCGAFVQSESALLAGLQSACFSLKHGYSDMVLLICAGSYAESLTLASLYQMEHLSPCNHGAASVRPFDLRRDGTIVGEGAVALVLEPLRLARQRGVLPLALVDGWAGLAERQSHRLHDDAYRVCLSKALGRSALSYGDLDVIVANGTGSHPLDRYIVNMLQELPPDETRRPITCVAPIIGSAPGCPGDWLAAVEILQHQQVPPIGNLEQPISPELQFVSGRPLPKECKHVVVLNSGHTGFHSAVIFSAPEV